MKILLTLLALCALAVAQTGDADKQKLIDIEQAGLKITSFNSPEMTEFFQKHLYDGTSSVVVPTGHLYYGPKSMAIAATKPDPNDPNVKTINKASDFKVDVYGDTALVSYKVVSTDSGHRNPALNAEVTMTTLDTFVKRNGSWYLIGSASVLSEPMAQAQWDAIKKMEAQTSQKPPSQ